MKIRVPAPGTGPAAVDAKVYGDQAPEARQKLAAKRYRHQRLERSLWSVPERGKRPVLSYTTSPAYHMIEEKKDNCGGEASPRPLSAGRSSQRAYRRQQAAGTGGKIPQIYGISRFQNAIPTGNWMYPVTKVTLPGLDTSVKPQTTLSLPRSRSPASVKPD